MQLIGKLAPAAARPAGPAGEVSADPAEAGLPAPVAPPPRRPVALLRRADVAGPLPASRFRPSLRSLSFAVLVLLPTALAALYYFGVAADQYLSEFRFTLSAADFPRADTPLSLLVGSSVRSPAALQSQVLVQYIASRAIVDDIGRSVDLRRLFAAPQADWWSRLAQPAPIEELVAYWRRHIDPFYDPANGTVTVRVRAFAPADALRIAQAIAAACERLVNDLSLRARRDTLRRAETELAQSETRLSAILGEIRAFRDRAGLIDPGKAAESGGVLATRLRDELVDANAKLATLRAYMRDDAPSVKVLKARIRSLEAQRRSLAHQLTGPERPPASSERTASSERAGSPALSGILGSYEELESRRKFAEAAYQLALHGVDQARADADRQQVFIAGFIPPSLPEEALYPRRWRSVGIVALMAFAVWAIGGLAVQSVREHLW